MTHLSELIQQKRRGLSNRELGRQSGLSETEIRSIKKGDRIPKPETLEKLAHALAISLQELQNARDKDRGITRRGFLELAR
jgi:transcriptional regulator with XRE-family HTH domain